MGTVLPPDAIALPNLGMQLAAANWLNSVWRTASVSPYGT